MSESRTSGEMGPGLMRVALTVVGLVVFLGGCAIAGLTIFDYNQNPGMPIGKAVSLAVGAMLLGMLLAALLFAASGILGVLARVLEHVANPAVEPDDVRPALGRLEQSLRMLNTLQTRNESTAVRGTVGVNGTNLAPLLEQLRDFSLMNNDQRERFAVRHWRRRRDVLTELIERDVLIGDWTAAFRRLEDLQLLMPDDTQVAELAERVQSEQNARLEEEMRVARNQLRHFVEIASWQQANELAAELQRKYPGKAEPVQFASDVRREHEAYERANMDRLFRDIASATERRQWRAAVLAIEEFIRRYPNEVRAESLRLDLPTLVENAAAHERKEQEESFKDLLKRHRYNEAIAVARGVIQKYPKSPAAAEYHKLLPRIEEFARQQESARQAAAGQVPAAAGASA